MLSAHKMQFMCRDTENYNFGTSRSFWTTFWSQKWVYSPPGGRDISNAEANKAMKRREKGLLMKRKRKMRCCQKQMGLRYKWLSFLTKIEKYDRNQRNTLYRIREIHMKGLLMKRKEEMICCQKQMGWLPNDWASSQIELPMIQLPV